MTQIDRKARPRGVIALDYGVHQVTISRIKTGKDWSHIKDGGDLNGTD